MSATVHDLSMRDGDSRSEWATNFSRTVADETRHGVRSGAITWAEADELLARLRVLVDQALDFTPQFS